MNKTFNDLRKINVNELLEKKGNLSYLSWAHAVDLLLQNDPSATWDFAEPQTFGQTVMVSCSVTAFGKTMKMHLPVMDNRNNAVSNPDARKISDAMMRCLAKCIACFGIGLYIYAGEDVPTEQEAETTPDDLKTYRVDFGKKYFGKMIHEIPANELESTIIWFEDEAKKTGNPITGKAKRFVELATIYMNQGES
jgi:hypothetical protein